MRRGALSASESCLVLAARKRGRTVGARGKAAGLYGIAGARRKPRGGATPDFACGSGACGARAVPAPRRAGAIIQPVSSRAADRAMLRRFWLLFAQACTLCVAALFVVATLRPDLLPRLSGRVGPVVLTQEAQAPAAAKAVSAPS